MSLHHLVEHPEVKYPFVGLRIHLFHRGGENDIRANTFQQEVIFLGCTWIVLQVLNVVELGGVHEDTHHAKIIFSCTTLHEGGMSLVKSTHGRDKTNCFSCEAKGL